MAGHSRRRRRDSILRPTFLSDDENRSLLNFYRPTIAAVDILHGLGYVLGAPATAPSLLLMQKVMPMWVWGAVLVAAGVMVMITRVRAVGLAAGGFVMLVWAGYSAAVLLPGAEMPATGWGWPPYAGFAVLHIVGTWFNSTAATRRR